MEQKLATYPGDIQFGDMEELLLLYKCTQETLVNNHLRVIPVSPEIVRRAWFELGVKWPERWSECMEHFDSSSKTFWARHAGSESHVLFVRTEAVDLFGWDLTKEPFVSYKDFLFEGIQQDRNPQMLANYDLPGVQASREHPTEKNIVVCRYNMHLRSAVSRQLKEVQTHVGPGVGLYEFKDKSREGKVRANSRDQSYRLMWLLTAKTEVKPNGSGPGFSLLAREGESGGKRRRMDDESGGGVGARTQQEPQQNMKFTQVIFSHVPPVDASIPTTTASSPTALNSPAPPHPPPAFLGYPSMQQIPLPPTNSPADSLLHMDQNTTGERYFARLLEGVVRANLELETLHRNINRFLYVNRTHDLYAAMDANISAFRFLAHRCVDVKQTVQNWRDGASNSLLHLASTHGNIMVAKVLIYDYEIPLGVPKTNFSTPCHIAFYHHQWRFVADVFGHWQVPVLDPAPIIWSRTQSQWLPIQSAYNISVPEVDDAYNSPRQKLIRQYLWCVTIEAGKRHNFSLDFMLEQLDLQQKPIGGSEKYLRQEYDEEKNEFLSAGRDSNAVLSMLNAMEGLEYAGIDGVGDEKPEVVQTP